MPGNAGRQPPVSNELGALLVSAADFPVRECLGEPGSVKPRRPQQRMKGHRQPRRRLGDPAEPAIDVGLVPTQCAVFELQIDRVEGGELAADILDCAVGQRPHAPMGAPHQVLVERKQSDVEGIVEVVTQRSGIGRDAAQLPAACYDREPLLARG